MKEGLPQRDEKGDFIYKLPRVDRQKERWWDHTHVCLYRDESRDTFLPFFGIAKYDDDALAKAKQTESFFQADLFYTPDTPPFDFFIGYHNWQLQLRVHYFKEVFEEQAFIQGYMPSHEFFRLIMPKSKYEEIINCINDFGLLTIRDLLFEVIAIAQEKYERDIAFWEKPEQQKIVSRAAPQSREVIRLIEKIDDKKWFSDPNAEPPETLLRLNFVFQKETIKIDHPWLAKEFIEHFKEYYDDLPYQNWKLDLERYPDRFADIAQKQQFKYRLAQSFYNLLTEQQFFKLQDGTPYPNDLMNCICRMLEFCLIEVGKPDSIEADKIKHIRNWLTRSDLKEAVTFLPVPPNREMLLHYFTPDFVDLTGDVKRADALAVALFLSKRFNLEKLIPELAHIAQILIETNHFRNPIENDPNGARFAEADAFSKLLSVTAGRKITGIKFTLENDPNEYTLSQRMPLYLIEEAVREHYNSVPIEFGNDIVKTSVVRSPSGYTVTKENRFNEPETRFAVWFVKSFYQFLFREDPPSDNAGRPSVRYYEIISCMLIQSLFFRTKIVSEKYVVELVEKWHALSNASSA